MKRLAALLIVLELMTGCVTWTQIQMDAEVDRLCAIDGGLKIYETVTLPPEMFNEHNDVIFFHPTLGENALGSKYLWKKENIYLQPGGDPKVSPRMWRRHTQIFRRSDIKLLGESVEYVRYGGDPHWLNELYGGPPESHYSCPKNNEDILLGVFINSENRRMK